jgi:predicted permease
MFRQNLRYAARSLRYTPGFTIAAVITLALGIGASTAVFSVVDGVLLHPVPFSDPDRLVALYGTYRPRFEKSSFSYPDFLDWQQQNRSFQAIAAWRTDLFTLTGRGQPEQLMGTMISAELLSILRVEPTRGRGFRREEDTLGAEPVVVIGEGFWKRRFASDPTIVGQDLTLNGRRYGVIGVMPSSVRLVNANGTFFNDVFVPIGQYDEATFRARGSQINTFGLGRLNPGVTPAQAQAEMDSIARNLEAAYPRENKGWGISVITLAEDIGGDRRTALFTLLGAVAFVLLIVCANVANLTLVRVSRRAHDLAVRMSLGANRRHVITQLLTESVLLSAVGAAGGVILAAWGTQAVLGVLPAALPAMSDIGLNWRVLTFALSLSLVTTVLVGVAPAFRAVDRDLKATLDHRGRGTTLSYKSQRVVVIAQVALTLVLLVGAGLMLRSLQRLWSVNPGFEPQNLLTFYTSLSADRSATPERVRAALRELEDRVSSVPGVESTSIVTSSLPLAGHSTTTAFFRDGQPRPAAISELPLAVFQAVGVPHFRTMEIPFVRGRSFTASDDMRAPRVVIIDDQLARSVFGDSNPIGQRLRSGLFREGAEVVGVVGHVKHWGLDTDANATVRLQMYVPHAQLPDLFAQAASNIFAVVVRSTTPPARLLPAIKTAISGFDSTQAIHTERLYADVIGTTLAPRRFSLAVLGVFAAVALLLSMVGIYGVLSYLVSQRTREIGVRVALGAGRLDVLSLILSEGGRVAIMGIGVGVALSLGMTRFIQGSLFDVSATDPLTLTAVAVLLLGVMLAACYVPASRAVRIDPAVALRAE